MLALPLAGCRNDMRNQPKYKPLAPSSFFADGRSARPLPPGAIARGEQNFTDAFHTGSAEGAFLDRIPVTVDGKLLRRGRDRFDIFCSPCHGLLGDGAGMIARRGFKIPANFHTDRLRQAPPGYLYQVITYGYGAMGDYADQIPVEDRWAIVAYIRALQLSRNASASDLPPKARAEMEKRP